MGGVGIYRAIESLFWNQGCNIGMDGFTFFIPLCHLLSSTERVLLFVAFFVCDYSNVFSQSENQSEIRLSQCVHFGFLIEHFAP